MPAASMSRTQYASIQGLIGESKSTLSASELQRMKDIAMNEDERRAMQLEATRTAKAASLAKSDARKQKMVELEAQRKLAVPPSEEEQAKLAEKALMLTAADRQMAEELDDVKKMNQMMLYSKVVTIRDAQLNEKKTIEKERLEEERRLDTIMEVERLKALKMYDEREYRRKEDQKKGAQVIINQMRERERERVRQLELQDQEREAMLRQNADMKKEEVNAMVGKKEAGRKLLEQVAASNAEQIELKKAEKEQMKTEELMIQVYLRQKELREQERQQAEDAIKAEKERETARLRAMQEKMKDKQAELDALRAKRAAEESERQWRKTQQLAAEREETIQNSLDQAREAQKLEKERRLIEQAQQEKEEFDRILRVQREAETAEQMSRGKKLSAAHEHMQELQAQILMNAEVRKKSRMEFLDEGVQQRAAMEAGRLKLEGIKAEKLGSLTRAGIPQKYTVDLANKKFT